MLSERANLEGWSEGGGVGASPLAWRLRDEAASQSSLPSQEASA